MSALIAIAQPAAVASGSQWHADIYRTHIVLRVGPMGSVTAAVEHCVAPTQLRFWNLEWIFEDEFGWDVYLFERE